jgi:hypothetical protein
MSTNQQKGERAWFVTVAVFLVIIVIVFVVR